MIYVDDANIKRKAGRHSTKRWFHLIADPPDEDELIDFAESIGLSRSYIQRTTCTHFDITAGMKHRAMAKDAIQITQRQLMEKVRVVRRLRGQS